MTPNDAALSTANHVEQLLDRTKRGLLKVHRFPTAPIQLLVKHVQRMTRSLGSYDPATGVYDEASLRAAAAAWMAMEYELNAREEWALGEYDRVRQMQIAVERAMAAHPFVIDPDNNYVEHKA